MRILAYLGNIAFIIFLLVRATNQDHLDGKVIGILLLFLTLPVVNLFVIVTSGNERNIFSLYCERKKLEQEQKIVALKKSMGREI